MRGTLTRDFCGKFETVQGFFFVGAGGGGGLRFGPIQLSTTASPLTFDLNDLKTRLDHPVTWNPEYLSLGPIVDRKGRFKKTYPLGPYIPYIA